MERNTFPTPRFKADELFFPHDNYPDGNGFKEVVANLLKNPLLELGSVGLCHILYNSAIGKVTDKHIYDLCEKESFKYKGKLTRHLAIGGHYGSVLSNVASPKLIEFFENEISILFKGKDALTASEAYRLFLAYSDNIVLDPEHKKDYAKRHLIPLLKKNFFHYKHQEKKLLELFKAGLKLNISDNHFLDHILSTLTQKKEIGSIPFRISLYEFLHELQSSFYRSLAPELRLVRRSLRKSDDAMWRYNLNEKRWYTYEELKEKRDDYKFTDQMLGLRSDFQKFRMVSYLEMKGKNMKEIELKQSAERMKREIEERLEDLFLEYKLGNLTYELKELKSKLSHEEMAEAGDENAEDFLGSKKDQLEVAAQMGADERNEATKKLFQEFEDLDDPEKLKLKTKKMMKEMGLGERGEVFDPQQGSEEE